MQHQHWVVGNRRLMPVHSVIQPVAVAQNILWPRDCAVNPGYAALQRMSLGLAWQHITHIVVHTPVPKLAGYDLEQLSSDPPLLDKRTVRPPVRPAVPQHRVQSVRKHLVKVFGLRCRSVLGELGWAALCDGCTVALFQCPRVVDVLGHAALEEGTYKLWSNDSNLNFCNELTQLYPRISSPPPPSPSPALHPRRHHLSLAARHGQTAASDPRPAVLLDRRARSVPLCLSVCARGGLNSFPTQMYRRLTNPRCRFSRLSACAR